MWIEIIASVHILYTNLQKLYQNLLNLLEKHHKSKYNSNVNKNAAVA